MRASSDWPMAREVSHVFRARPNVTALATKPLASRYLRSLFIWKLHAKENLQSLVTVAVE